VDLLGIGFILLFGVVGAAIAYGADWLGRTIGKKRLSFRKLRPRYTAALITTGAGFLIPILTVVLVALSSQDVRVWLIEGRKAIRQNQELIRKAADDRKQFEAEIADLQRQRENLAKQTMELRQSFKGIQAQVDKQNEEIRDNKKLLEGERTKLAAAQRQREQAQARVASLESKYAGLAQKYGKLEEGYQKQVQNLNDNVAAINKDLSAKEQRLAETKKELDTTVKQFDTARETFERDIAAARTDLEKYRTARDEAQAAYETVKGEKERVEWELARLRQLQTAAQQGLDLNLRITRTQPLIFRGGEELARVKIGANQSLEGARAGLTSLLRSARVWAERRGAAVNSDGVSAGLVDIPMERGVVTAQDQFDALAKAVAERPDETVLIAYAFWNGFAGEFLPLRVEAYQNPIVFSRGQRITETRVDGTQSEEAILEQIQSFLLKEVGQQAIKSGMIPAVGAARPRGGAPAEDVLALVKEIKDARRTIRLLAMAAQDTRAADSLKVEFRVR
jgi:uncharacterized protein (DUF3084 family)